MTNLQQNRKRAETIVSFQVNLRRNEHDGKPVTSANLYQRLSVHGGEMIIEQVPNLRQNNIFISFDLRQNEDRD